MSDAERYDAVSYELARSLTLRYSSSFGLASKLFAHSVRPHIYAIYGMVRIADEIVDTYGGSDTSALLNAFERDTMQAVTTGYSTNPILQAFALTAQQFYIDKTIIAPFFASMRSDLTKTTFTQSEYDTYIYGSAEVIGLMCLKVFCAGDEQQYEFLAPGARVLGSVYQKVNFLRDFAADYRERGRVYFPDVSYESWGDDAKRIIEADIAQEFASAKTAIRQLPPTARTSVYLSYVYYRALFRRLQRMNANDIKQRRAHVPTITKLWLLITAPIGARFA